MRSKLGHTLGPQEIVHFTFMFTWKCVTRSNNNQLPVFYFLTYTYTYIYTHLYINVLPCYKVAFVDYWVFFH